MKTHIQILIAFCVTATASVYGQKIGDSQSAVDGILGKPTTALDRNGQHICIYKNGTKVVFENSVVVKLESVKDRSSASGNDSKAGEKNICTRLLGAWKSDKERTRSYWKSLKSGPLSDKVEEILNKYIGKDVLVFANDHLTQKTEEGTENYTYEVVGEYTSSVKIRILSKANAGELVQVFNFDGGGVMWTPWPDNPALREYYSRL